ncbi:uncharacterized protein [Prorops nasuta]|uniref:uncharacterized protein n=1 Tax=Prorops nasuta TaxID=863751 RepID=UPI0034CEA833
MLRHFLHLHSEPVNGAKPRVASTAKYDVLSNFVDGIVTMLCPAQGHPLPSYRTGESSRTESSTDCKNYSLDYFGRAKHRSVVPSSGLSSSSIQSRQVVPDQRQQEMD